MDNNAAVWAEELSFRHLLAELPTVSELSARISPGERLLLLGPSGSGKSTLAKLLNGLIPHSVAGEYRGRLSVMGENPAERGPARLATRVGLIFQNPESQFCTLRVDDEVAFGLENLAMQREQMDLEIEAALQSVDMWEHRHRRLDRLSGGMKQRVAVASVIAMSPELLILDEPVAHMDPRGTRNIVELLTRMAQRNPKLTLLLIEHRIDAWIRLMDRVWILSGDGRLIADGPPREVYSTRGERRVWRPGPVAAADWARDRGAPAKHTPLLAEELIGLAKSDTALRHAVLDWARAGADEAVAADLQGAAELPSPSSAPLLALREVGYTYGDGTRALDGVSIDVQPGTVCAVLGNNGCGKTTLAELAVGIRRPSEGRALLNGESLSALPARKISELCGFVFQNPEHQFVTDSVFDEVAFSLRRRHFSEAEVGTRVDTLLSSFRLQHKAAANPFELSQGEKRRLSVAAMLVSSPQLLVLDEPTFGQDPDTAQELAARFREMADSGIAILIVTHDLDLVWRIADRAVVLHRGRTVATDNARRLLTNRGALAAVGLEAPFPAELVAELDQR